ncbi:hypothetical protein SDC9_209615 [bioreactor metagenome]|uniref:Uncharacterized protein n=1 Tax=bioreactor metagenome TaxID=1076179 RepID=A0A645JFJ9_9ZZZZ
MQRHNLEVIADGKLGAKTEAAPSANAGGARRTRESHARCTNDEYHPARAVEMAVTARR